MTDDPFSPEANPYPDLRPTRRELALGALAVSALGLTAGCVPRRLACATAPGDREHCQMKFCRYYRKAP